ncbi:hypothetical protein [Streptomyces sp. NRRL S-87]|uniref:hypothetical protein n=1 Tax=Streptomyces sp. NRRL S-87 TaxID=1463920 RepID=UPI00099B3EE4|nr:hypothetical protein [Streptomyces sp. NRRL S-87]
MNAILNALAVLSVAVLLAGPAVYGALRERRTDRQLRGAAAGRPGVAVGRGASRPAQKSSSRSTVPSTATW